MSFFPTGLIDPSTVSPLGVQGVLVAWLFLTCTRGRVDVSGGVIPNCE